MNNRIISKGHWSTFTWSALTCFSECDIGHRDLQTCSRG